MWGLQVSFVGKTEEAAREAAEKEGYGGKVAVVKTSFKANSKVQDSQCLCLYIAKVSHDTVNFGTHGLRCVHAINILSLSGASAQF